VEGYVEFIKTLFQASFSILSYTYAFKTYNIMLNRRGNSTTFAEAGRLPILARGRSIKNYVSEILKICKNTSKSLIFLFLIPYFSHSLVLSCILRKYLIFEQIF
jgi:hypothetical protein